MPHQIVVRLSRFLSTPQKEKERKRERIGSAARSTCSRAPPCQDMCWQFAWRCSKGASATSRSSEAFLGPCLSTARPQTLIHQQGFGSDLCIRSDPPRPLFRRFMFCARSGQTPAKLRSPCQLTCRSSACNTCCRPSKAHFAPVLRYLWAPTLRSVSSLRMHSAHLRHLQAGLLLCSSYSCSPAI